MLNESLLLHTKLSPPRPQRRTLARPALTALLRQALDHRLTIVQARTGYSKTTALASLGGDDTDHTSLFWYSVGPDEIEPQRFLAYLVEAFRKRLPNLSDLPLAALQEYGNDSTHGAHGARVRVVDALLNALADVLPGLPGPALLILDDYHFVDASSEINLLIERLITYAPPDLHVVVSTRYPPSWPGLVTWRARGEALEVGREALAFRPDEVESLFRDVYGRPLSPQELDLLIEKTEGWPIALQLAWQGLRGANADAGGQNVAGLMREGSTSLSALFDYLARDVLGSQPPRISAFLRDTAVLRELTPAACDAVRQESDSASILERLIELDLFIVTLGQRHFRYHHLFHDFLLQQAESDLDGARERHRRAARYFEGESRHEEAIYHSLRAGDFSEAAAAIERAGEDALRSGWLGTVVGWIDSLPPEALADRPTLQALMGDVYRMQSRFDEALGWYSQAEQLWRAKQDLAGVSRALRGQALVYLDTVRPSEAESFLEEALRLSDGLPDREARARLLELIAENKLNMGKPDEAEKLRAEARTLREDGPGEDALSVRVKLRTGKLDEAERILESWVGAERKEFELGMAHPPRAHRETLLLLSLISSMRGNADRAFQLAEEGVALGARLNSPFVTAVGRVRLGHALQLLSAGRRAPTEDERPKANDDDSRITHHASLEEAALCYETAIALGDELAVRRTRVEAMWGLTRAYGFAGDLESAQRAASEGVETGRWAGDAWIVGLIELALGASYVLWGQPQQAFEILSRVLSTFRECGDNFGRAVTRLWLGLTYNDLGQGELSLACVEEGLGLCEAHGYDFLFKSPTLLGPPDPRRLVPLLLAARAHSHRLAYVTRLLGEIGLPGIEAHPGYQLRVHTLGAFRLFRGQIEVEAREWHRDKARQLFQLLLTQRGRWLHREEIAESLWPALTPEAAGRDFKVALNALYRALEPGRSSDSPSAFIARQGASYRLRIEADLWIDSVEFERECQAGLRLSDNGAMNGVVGEVIARLQSAVALYRGSYLPDALYQDWSSAERERLLSLYLRAADRLAGALVEVARYDEAIDVCSRILAHDSCWENAYRWMMLAHARQGNRPQALRAYQRCAETVLRELSVEPSQTMRGLYQRIAEADDLQRVR